MGTAAGDGARPGAVATGVTAAVPAVIEPAVPEPVPDPTTGDVAPAGSGPVTAWWVVVLRVAQVAVLVAAVVALSPRIRLDTASVVAVGAPLVLVATALLFTGAARRARAGSALDSLLSSAWALLATAGLGVALLRLIWAAPPTPNFGPPLAAGLTLACGLELAAVWLLLRGPLAALGAQQRLGRIGGGDRGRRHRRQRARTGDEPAPGRRRPDRLRADPRGRRDGPVRRRADRSGHGRPGAAPTAAVAGRRARRRHPGRSAGPGPERHPGAVHPRRSTGRARTSRPGPWPCSPWPGMPPWAWGRSIPDRTAGRPPVAPARPHRFAGRRGWCRPAPRSSPRP